MRDEIIDRDYQDGREQLNVAIERAASIVARTFWQSFSRVHDLQWQAPWRNEAERRRSGRAGLA